MAEARPHRPFAFARAPRRARGLVIGTVSFGLVALTAAPSALATPLSASETTEQLAPGIVLRTLRPLTSAGFVSADVLEVRMGSGGARLGFLTQPTTTFSVSGISTAPSALARSAGAIGAVNGDAYDNGNTFAPNHAQILGGALTTSGPPSETRAWPTIGVSRAGLGLLDLLTFGGTVTRTDATSARTSLRLDAVNQHNGYTSDDVAVFTDHWGAATRNRLGGSNPVEVRVGSDGRVISVTSGTPGTGAVAAGEFYLVGREAGGTALQQFQVGDSVELTYALRNADGLTPDFDFALGAHNSNAPLVRNGVVTAADDGAGAANRTSVGFSADGRTAYLAAVRTANLPDLGVFMQSLGAASAVNLGGGGSTTLSARTAGAANVTVRTGSERNENGAVGVFTASGDGTARNLLIRPAGSARPRVFAGGRLPLTATPLDAGWGPATLSTQVSWSASAGSVDASGVFTAPADGGDVTLSASAGSGVSGSATIKVLPKLQRITASQASYSFIGTSSDPTFVSLTGRDAEGYGAPVDAATTALDYDRAIVDVAVQSDGRLKITPKATGSTVLWAKLGDAAVSVALLVGSGELPTVIPPAELPDRMVATDGNATLQQWSFAALANSGIAAGGDAGAQAATRAVKAARAAGADLVLLSGVTAGASGQAAAARSALEAAGCDVIGDGESVPAGAPSGGTVPCVATAGIADRVGGSLSEWGAGFGAAWRGFDHRGVRFVLLDSSATQLRATSAQLRALATALDGAETDSSIHAVVVLTTRPTTDPLGDTSRALTDANEVALLRTLLRGFHDRSHKGVTLIDGESRIASVRRDEGVAEFGLPTVAGEPRGDVAAGGFSGWTRFTVDTEASDAGLDTIGADVRPFASQVAVDAADEVLVDEAVDVIADVEQGSRTVPLRYPASPRWSGSANLAIGSGAAALRDAKAAGKVALLDPASGELTGLAEGEVTVTATADGDLSEQPVAGSATVSVVAPEQPQEPGGEEPNREQPGGEQPGGQQPLPGGQTPVTRTPDVLQPTSPLPSGPVRTGKVAVKASAAKAGAVRVTLSVAKGSTATATVQLRAKLRVGRKTAMVLVGRGSATLGDGGSKTLTLKLNAAGRKALKKARKLKLQVVVSARDAAGKLVRTTKSLTVKR
ncbi:phosphodiester glycosidase family protein [Conexibacter sp. JD483]|uniref:phosphodiester glycosidase family protein n=1 Tax=unclassified Conexibacter TaxID=2627773 RepID=UPI002716A965|nr:MULTISPECIES: phosphodiester glycosidase family protein [unclassified Conexibacter]MDO8187268.1 phosphodiester glycosidase family protein [Conexibacter sp. CPCC 205706]MDO8198877.1 phosphodiester glycosidase family protein [Conexibacter sp. CPCC 205762]MDR9371853.1 phosphodiester glycosidase family protein [Conexibacter sp. JD483]